MAELQRVDFSFFFYFILFFPPISSASPIRSRALIFLHPRLIFPHSLEICVVKKTKYPSQLLLFLSPFLLIITVHLIFCNAKTIIKHLFCLTSNPSTQHTPRCNPSKPPQLQTIKHKSSKHTHNQTQVNVKSHFHYLFHTHTATKNREI